MKVKPENPQAFPINSKHSLDEIHYYGKAGMTLRDYFAAKAMVGVYSYNDFVTEQIDNDCRIFYKIADAMLKERNK